MANVKSKVNTPQKSSKRGRKSTKTTPNPPVNNAIESLTVMKRPSSFKVLTPDEQLKIVLNNGHLYKKDFVNRHFKTSLVKDRLMSKSGKIRKKCMTNMLLFDNILKSELMIDESTNKVNSVKVTESKIEKKSNSTINNNNDAAISDHNISSLPKNEAKEYLIEFNKSKSIKKTKTKNKSNSKSTKSDYADNGTQNIDLDKLPGAKRKKFECDYCSKLFYAKTSIRRHIFEHINLPLHKCPHCPKKFQYDFVMQSHIVAAHRNLAAYNVADYKCDICDQTFLLPETCNKHLESHTKNTGQHKCMFCSETFSKYYTLTQHEKKHLKDGSYQCTLCIKKFNERELLMDHLKCHLKIKEFICHYCGKEFLRLKYLQRHVEVCHSGHRIPCPICKKLLKGHLTEHMRTHETKRPHKCPDCGQRFIQSTQLNVHRRAHTGERPYPCRICDRRFSHSNALILHIRRHTGEKPFPCAMCPFKFSQLPHMKAHMRNIHGKDNAYKCKKCEQFFKLKVDLENHATNCKVGDKELSFEEKILATVTHEEIEVESVMTLSRMRYLLALLLNIIASKGKLKYLGFNKRLIDDLLIDSLEAMGLNPNKDQNISAIQRLKLNIEMLLHRTIPKEQMDKLLAENKTTEEILELLTDENKNERKTVLVY